MPLQKTLRIIFFLLLICVSLSCEKSPTGPEPFRDPRTYTWRIDTLAYPGSFQTAMRDIWGSSPRDVYVVGHNDGAFGKMYHYDGKTWRPVDLAFGAIDLAAIFGFGPNDIYAVGDRFKYNPTPPPNFLDSSLIIHFDGARWKEHRVSGGRFLLTIWGSAPDNVWAAGGEGTLLHYDGTRWSKVPMDAQYSFNVLAGFGRNEVYLLGNRFEGPPGDLTRGYRVLFRYDGNAWRAIDSMHVGSLDVFADLEVIGGSLYATGYGVWVREGDRWRKVLTSATASLQAIHGSSPSNIFAVGFNSHIYHYDGRTWQQLTDIIQGEWWLSGVWVFERETFIVGCDPGGFKTIILHGK